ncbi:MAG: hypothetical protein ACK5GN_05835 [Pseudomonadota bacterium]|jgi:hypothetical protein
MTRDNKRNTAIYTAFDDYDANDIPVPEKGLLRAILVTAIADMNREDEHARKARSYFLSKEDDYIFSFQAVCSYLNINPHHILVLVGLEKPARTAAKQELIQAEVRPESDTENLITQ